MLSHMHITKPYSMWWALAFGWQAFDMAYKPFLNKAPSAMDKSVNLLKIPMSYGGLGARDLNGFLVVLPC
ncbi:hypothetical protein NC652_027692 [Populus alba x Populus x berolinensis]|nr:hypothetical protein NC652_027692 [Populus alba x Populus x berolinensis]